MRKTYTAYEVRCDCCNDHINLGDERSFNMVGKGISTHADLITLRIKLNKITNNEWREVTPDLCKKCLISILEEALEEAKK